MGIRLEASSLQAMLELHVMVPDVGKSAAAW
jgi:hypothetical protein